MTTKINTPAAKVTVTKGPDAVTKGAYKSRHIAALSISKHVAQEGTLIEPKAPRKPACAAAPAKDKAGNTFTTVDLAKEHGINAKTLRARIRRNLDKWEPLFANGMRHVYNDNLTTRRAIDTLLDI